MSFPALSRNARVCWIVAALLLAVALILPVESVVDLLGRSVNTVRNFRADFVRGFQVFRVALAANAVLLAVLPWILARAEFGPSPPGPWNRQDLLPAALLYAVPFLFAIPGMRDSFQNDEWRTLVEYIQHGPLIITTRSVADNHPFYGLLAWPFVAILGKSELALRLPSLLLAPLGPPLLFLLLRRDQDRRRAYLAALPLSVSPFLISYAHEGRGYGILFPAILGLCLLQPAAVSGSRRVWIAYIGLGIAAVYTHIYASMAVVGLAAAAFWRPEGRTAGGRARILAAFLLIAGLSFLLYSPILLKFFEYSSRVKGSEMSYRGTYDSVFSECFVHPLSGLWALPFVATAAAGLFFSRRPTPEAVAWILTSILQLALTEGSGSERVGRLFAPALILAWPVLSAALARRAAGPLVAVALLILSLTADIAYLRLGRRDFRKAAEELAQRRKPGETMAILFDCRPMNRYLKDPIEVLSGDELVARAPDWFTLIDQNLVRFPSVAALGERDYEVVFRLPSARGELRGYRKKPR